jgi:hypothetical protein
MSVPGPKRQFAALRRLCPEAGGLRRKKLTTLKEVGNTLAFIVEKMATKDDITDIRRDMVALEKRLGDRIDGLTVKVEGVQKTIDTEALQRSDLQLPQRVHQLEKKVFGHSKHPKHLPL